MTTNCGKSRWGWAPRPTQHSTANVGGAGLPDRRNTPTTTNQHMHQLAQHDSACVRSGARGAIVRSQATSDRRPPSNPSLLGRRAGKRCHLNHTCAS
eukprot:6263964-Alexandrium_andersonii.AAC.1